MIECRRPLSSRAVNFSQGMVTGAGPGLIPRCFVECRISVVIAVEMTQAQAQVVSGFTIVRIGIAARQAIDGFTKTRLGFREFTTAKMPQGHGVVATCIERVTSLRSAPVPDRGTHGMPSLIQMQTGYVQIVHAHHLPLP